MVERSVRLRLEEEAALRDVLESLELGRSRADEEIANAGVQLDAERLRARALARERAEPALGVDRGRALGEDRAVALARRAAAREDLARPLGDVLARHLDEAERRDLDDVRLRPVALELALQRLLDRRPVLRVRHVDEVDDDDAADVAQPKLPDDLLRGLDVVLRHRLLEPRRRRPRARADEAAGVDVDDGERLGVVEDEVAAGREVDALVEGRADLGVDAVGLEERRALLVARDALGHVRRRLLEVAGDAPHRLVVVDERALEVLGEEVADDAERQLGLGVDEARRGRLLRARLDLLPELLEEAHVALDVLRRRAFRRRADDEPAIRQLDRAQDLLEASALVVLEPPETPIPSPSGT